MEDSFGLSLVICVSLCISYNNDDYKYMAEGSIILAVSQET